MKWLLNHRTDFGDNGWAQLCGPNMKFGVMGGHHVSETFYHLSDDIR